MRPRKDNAWWNDPPASSCIECDDTGCEDCHENMEPETGYSYGRRQK